MSANQYTVGQLARMAHVTVRTLHHYHEIGLLVPSGRSVAGYRLYEGADLERLHGILLFRELGFPLEEIRALLDRPGSQALDTLLSHRGRLTNRAERLEATLRAVDERIDTLREGRPMDVDTMFRDFSDPDHAEHAAEAEKHWGDTEAWAESRRMTRSYGPTQWAEMKADLERIEGRWTELLEKVVAPADLRATDVAEAARRHIDRWFYRCSHEMHVSLAEMYESDPRFRAHYEAKREGLAAFVAASIRENAARDPE